MDTSETYIKMCEKAEEIQRQKFFRVATYFQDLYATGDWFSWNDKRACPESGVKQSFDDGWSKEFWEFPSSSVWLPRQDQLQEMVLPNPNEKDAWGDLIEYDLKTDHAFWLAKRFTDSIQEKKYSQQSMEQLWFTFVMKEKYNKTWDGEKWMTLKC